MHGVIETARGHNLGRVIHAGSASPNTGIPGDVNGITAERVVYAPCAGTLTIATDIGSRVEKGEIIARIGSIPIYAPIAGLVRGMIRDKFLVQQGLKIADIEPRLDERENCFTISDKARSISGGVLEAILYFLHTNKTKKNKNGNRSN